MVLGIIKI